MFADKFTRQLGYPGRVLEIGCAAGMGTKAARDRGWTVKGVEVTPKFSKFARYELGLDVFEGFIDQIPTDTWEPFDVIMHSTFSNIFTIRSGI